MKVTRQPPATVRIACPRFPAAMRVPLVWGRDVRSYEDLVRAYGERGTADASHSSEPGHPARTKALIPST